ncbi:MAG: flavodoxin family protein [Vampirovibrionia bacterium]
MKITVFNGSPKGERSNTNIMVQEFLAGCESVGAETENIFLAKKELKHCIGCFTCWIKTPGKCVHKDDMAEMIETYLNSDIIVFASPVYIGGVTGLMKDFLDRLLPTADPRIGKTKDGVTCHYKRYDKTHKYVLISNCGFPEQMHFEYFDSCFKYLELVTEDRILARIYRGQGEMLGIDHPMLKLLLNDYKNTLRQAGKEIVLKGKLSDETIFKLEQPLVPYDQYVGMANKHFDEALEKIK